MTGQSTEPDEALISAIESILLVASDPVPVPALVSATRTGRGCVDSALDRLQDRLRGGIRLQRHDGTVQLVTAPENVETVQRFLGAERPPPLSRAALETLTVVAYRQPVTRAEIESARGVDSDHSLRRLLARGLVEERGRRDVVGRPVEYGTTARFLEYFGLSSLADLPPLPGEESEGVPAAHLGMRG
jgi:segregation and condensation protein B